MRNMKAVLAAALMVPLIGCRTAGAGIVQGSDRKVDAQGVKAVAIVLEDGAEVRFEEGRGAVEAVGFTYKGHVADPLALERDGDAVRVHLAKAPMFTDTKVKFTLRVPAGLDVTLKGSAASLSGRLAGRKVSIEADALQVSGVIEADTLRIEGKAVAVEGLKARAGGVEVVGSAVSVNISLEKGESLDVRGGAVSGRVSAKGSASVRVPPTVEVDRVL